MGEHDLKNRDGREKSSGKAGRDEKAEVAAKKKKEKLKTSKCFNCFNCRKMGHFATNCTEEKKDEESINSDESGADNPNFDEFEDDESCESGDDHFNLREFEDQDNNSTDQDVDSIDVIFVADSFVREIIQNEEHQATIGRELLHAEHFCPDILQPIMLMSDPSFGVINHGNGVQTLDIQDTYLLDSGSTLNPAHPSTRTNKQ